MIVRNLTIKIQGNRSVCDAPLYLHTQDKNIHIVINVTNNKFEIKDDMLLSFTIIKPNGDEVDRADCYIKNKQCHLLLNGAEFDEETEVGTHLVQMKLYDEFRQARLSLPPFAMHVLKTHGSFFADDVVEGLQAEQNAYKLMTENRLALEMNESILISDLPTTTEVSGYVPVTFGNTTYKLDMSQVATKDDVANVTIDLSPYATKEEVNGKANKTHNHDTVYAPINHEHDNYLKEHQDISHLATKDELVHNHDKQYAPKTHSHEQYLEEQDIEHLASKAYVANAIADAQLSGEGEEIDLSGYATKDDLLAKADKTYVDTYFLSKAIAEVNYSTIGHNHDTVYSKLNHTHDYSSVYAPKEHVHSYNDLTDKPTIPSVDGLATETYVNQAITNIESEYAKKTDIPTVPTKTSELTNDSNYLTSIPSEFVTETELDAKGYLTQHQDISHLATKSELSGYSQTGHTHTGMVTSTTVARIELVDELPQQQETGVLYIVRGE